MKKAAIYARYSSDNQREESIDAQIRAIKEFASKNSYKIVAIYTDEAKTATSDDRPNFIKMIKDSNNGLFDAVIVHKLDRFARNRYDSAYYKRALKQNDVRIISVLENLDDSPESIILESVLEGMAEYYSANLSREVMKGMRETAYQCKHTGGSPPLGYDVNTDRYYIVNEYEADIVKMIFDMYSKGHTYGDILQNLKVKNYKTKKGKEFSKNALTTILKNEKYKGEYVFNKTGQKKNGKRNVFFKSEEDIIRIPGGVPQIIDEDVWNMVNKRIEDSNKSVQASQGAKEVYLLTSLIECGECGSSMVGNRRFSGRNKKKYVTYECNTRKRTKECTAKDINKELVESIVIDYIQNELLTDKNIEYIADKTLEQVKHVNKELPSVINSYKKELSETNKEINNIVNAIAAGMFHISLKEKMDVLEAKKDDLVKKLEYAEQGAKAFILPNKEHMIKYLNSRKNIKNKPLEQQKAIIKGFIEKVVVFHDRIEIYSIVDACNGGEPIRFVSTILLPSSYRHLRVI